MAISGVVGAIYKASGTSATFTQKPLTNSGDNLSYFITDRTLCYWDNTQPLTIEKSTNGGTSWVTITTGFEVQHAGGYIVFTANQTTAIFRVSGKNFTPAAIGGGFNWSLDIETETLECSTFENNGWKSYIPSTRGFSGSFENYWLNGDHVGEIGSTTMILILYTDNSVNKNRYEGYATITTNSIETPNDDLVKESCDFSGGGKLFYRAG